LVVVDLVVVHVAVVVWLFNVVGLVTFPLLLLVGLICYVLVAVGCYVLRLFGCCCWLPVTFVVCCVCCYHVRLHVRYARLRLRVYIVVALPRYVGLRCRYVLSLLVACVHCCLAQHLFCGITRNILRCAVLIVACNSPNVVDVVCGMT